MKVAHFVNNQQFKGEKGFQSEKGLKSKVIFKDNFDLFTCFNPGLLMSHPIPLTRQLGGCPNSKSS